MSKDTGTLELYVSNFILVKLIVSQEKKNTSKLDIKIFLSYGFEPRPETFHVIYIGNHVSRINLQKNSDYFHEQHLQTAFVMKK